MARATVLPAVVAALTTALTTASSPVQSSPVSWFCFSQTLAQYFSHGDSWTELPCRRAICERGTVIYEACPKLLLPSRGCVLSKGKSGAPYPDCCSTVTCPQNGQCYSKTLGKIVEDGAIWAEPKCVGGSCVNGKVILMECPLLGLPPPGSLCRIVAGDPKAPYPGCCSMQGVCKGDSCYSWALRTQFKHGEKWTEPGCIEAECSDGQIKRKVVAKHGKC